MMRTRMMGVVAGLLVLLDACEHGPAVALQPVPQPPETSSGSLSPAAREHLIGKIDMAAVDRLMTTLAPEDQARFLRGFEDVEWAASGRRDVETQDVTVIVRYGAPERQSLLERAWAPFWSGLPPAVLADPSYPLPGRTLAQSRRADSTSAGSSEREP